MVEHAADEYSNVPVPRRIKVSSKRQITIPVDIYEKHGFSDYALLTETEKGFAVEPLKLADDDEDLTLALLRYLVDKKLEGEQLLKAYEALKPRFMSYYRTIRQSEDDEKTGRTLSFKELRRQIESEYDL